MSETRPRHVPVMLLEMVETMAVRPDGIYLDGTFGAGHYSRALLAGGAACVYGLDRDPGALAAAAPEAAEEPRLQLRHLPFSRLEEAVPDRGAPVLDGVVLDLGVSSMQLDEAERGFSFANDGPLDMRMDRAGATAADLVNQADEATLADIIHHHGEERRARRVARAIVQRRRARPFTRTSDLAAVVAGAVGRHEAGIHPATRTFQALRIEVNDELGELERGLEAAERALRPGGRLVVLAFHSLEDRIVKRFFSERAGGGGVSRHRPTVPARPPTFALLTRRPLRPGDDELGRNPRARSARLRAAERLPAPGAGA